MMHKRGGHLNLHVSCFQCSQQHKETHSHHSNQQAEFSTFQSLELDTIERFGLKASTGGSRFTTAFL